MARSTNGGNAALRSPPSSSAIDAGEGPGVDATDPQASWNDRVSAVARECVSVYESAARPPFSRVVELGLDECRHLAGRLGIDRGRVPSVSAFGRRMFAHGRRPRTHLAEDRQAAFNVPGNPGWDPGRPLAQVRLDVLDLGKDLVVEPSDGTGRGVLVVATDVYSGLIVAAGMYEAEPPVEGILPLFSLAVPEGLATGVLALRVCLAPPEAMILVPSIPQGIRHVRSILSAVGVCVILAPATTFTDRVPFEGLAAKLGEHADATGRRPMSVRDVETAINDWLRESDVKPVTPGGPTPRERWSRGVTLYPPRVARP